MEATTLATGNARTDEEPRSASRPARDERSIAAAAAGADATTAADATAASFADALAAARPAVAALLRRGGLDADRRGEALQEACARAWRFRASFDASRPLAPWLATIALRVATEQERARRRRPDAALGDDATRLDALAIGDDSGRDEGDAPFAALARREEVERLHGALQRLAPLPRAIVQRFHLDGASVAAIAQERAMPENTVKSHLRRARLALAEALREREDARASERRGGASEERQP